MTSYGRASGMVGGRSIVVEAKTLNSKFIDLRIKLPAGLSNQELWIRKVCQDELLRGKVELTVVFENEGGGEIYSINKGLFKSYYEQLSALSEELNIAAPDLIGAIVRLPEIVSPEEGTLSDSDLEDFRAIVRDTITQINDHRIQEGASIATVLENYVSSIANLLVEVDPHEKRRVEMIRSKMSNNLQEFMKKENVDENRFEQEIMFYLEKIDITEEKVRLRQHCSYFNEVLNESTVQKGRKLNFISQEMGREINTLGAKSYSSELQKIVVLMKDELEKIKEQLANVL